MVYLFIFIYLFICSFLIDFVKRGMIKHNMFYYFAYVQLILLAGLRYRVGGDTYNYMYVHEILPDLNNLLSFNNYVNREPGWLLLTAISKSFTPDFTLLQFIIAIFVNFVFFRFFNKYSAYKYTCLLFYFTFFYHYFNFEILRESIAVSFFLLAIDFFIEKKMTKYYIIGIIACFFHISSVIILVFPILYKILPIRKVFILPSLLFVINIFLGNFFSSFLSIFEVGEIINSKISTYQDYNFTVFGVISSYILYVLLPTALLKISKEKPDGLLYKFIYFYIYIGAMIPLFSIFFRFLNYFIPFYILLLTVFIMRILFYKKRFSANIGTATIAFTLLFCVLNFKFITKYEGEYWYHRWYPYHSVLDKQDDPVRAKWFPFLK